MLSKSKTQTQKLAIRLVRKILSGPRRRKAVGATIIALHGDLGAGKTTFVQGFMRALGVKNHITSPTFVIFRKYKLKSQKSRRRRGSPRAAKVACQMFSNVYHLDLYRINKPKELLDLGFKKILQDPHAIVLIEWPEGIGKLLLKNSMRINFEHGKKENERIIDIFS